MKVDWNQKYTTIAVYSFMVIAAAILFLLLLTGAQRLSTVMKDYVGILLPFLYGFMIAYILNFPMKFFERTMLRIKRFERMKPHWVHLIAVTLTYLLATIILVLFFIFVLPQLVTSFTGLVQNIPNYIRDTNTYVAELPERHKLSNEAARFVRDRWAELSTLINNAASRAISYTLVLVRTVAESIMLFTMSVIISVYMLAEKERFEGLAKKIIYSILKVPHAQCVIRLIHRSNTIFSKFFVGKIIDATIVGILTLIVLSIVQMPYALLVSFIIGVTNIVPFFGPFIGAIPSFVLIFFESPTMALWFILIVVIIQQIDGNIISPKILGGSMGVSSFWILFAILVAGRLFGLMGMIIGVPLFVFIYSIIKDISEARLKKRGLPIETEDYMDDSTLKDSSESDIL